MLLVENGRVLSHSAAAIGIAAGLGWPWRSAALIAKLAPRALRDQLLSASSPATAIAGSESARPAGGRRPRWRTASYEDPPARRLWRLRRPHRAAAGRFRA